MVLEILSQANWERPVYLSISLGSDMLSFLRDHLVLEGLAYRVSPAAVGQQGDTKRALAVCRKWQQEMLQDNVPYTDAALAMARCYYQAKQPEAGDAIVSSLLRRSGEWLSWIETITPTRRDGSLYSEYSWMRTMQQALSLAAEYGRNEIHHQYSKQYEHHLNH